MNEMEKKNSCAVVKIARDYNRTKLEGPHNMGTALDVGVPRLKLLPGIFCRVRRSES